MNHIVIVVERQLDRFRGERKRSFVRINAETNGGTATFIWLSEKLFIRLNVLPARSHSRHTEMPNESTAVMNVTQTETKGEKIDGKRIGSSERQIYTDDK